QARIELVNDLPGKPLAVERAGSEVLHHHVASLDELAKSLFALFALGIERDAALIAVEHGEIEAVDIRLVAQLAARDIAPARQLDLDHIGPEPTQDLRAGRPRLHVGHIEYANSIERFCHRLVFSLSDHHWIK